MKTHFYTFFLLFLGLSLFAQQKPTYNIQHHQTGEKVSVESLSKITPFLPEVPNSPRSLNIKFKPGVFTADRLGKDRIVSKTLDDAQTPIFMEAVADNISKRAHIPKSELALEVLAPAVSYLLNGETINEAFRTKVENTDELNITHIRYQQLYKNIPVFDGDYWAHIHETGKIIFNGRIRKQPENVNHKPSLEAHQSIEIVKDLLRAKNIVVTDLSQEQLDMIGTDQYNVQLTWHAADRSAPLQLCYHVSAIPNFGDKWEYFIDAHTGQEVVHFPGRCDVRGYISEEAKQKIELYEQEAASSIPYNTTKSFFSDGPTTATGIDLLGNSRPLNTYQYNNQYFMMDASRDMFVPGSIPNDPSGVIVTLNGSKTSPMNGNFSASDVISNNNQWNDRSAVSTHANMMLTYDYMNNTFQRNSWDGRGGNFIAFYNVADESGQDFDNAFWYQRFSFYGNGKTLFTNPICAALDVIAHELGHGVVQETAGLIYQDEPGALNEMYADMHAVMVDRDNWKLAEDIANPSFFPTGAMRDLSNPANGGTSLDDFGWQPGHVNEQYRGSQDYGGVHINSSIPGNAMYRIAQRTSREITEQIFYRALTMYLTKSSQFIDARIAVVQAARDLHGEGQVVQAVMQSFDEVGIVGESGGNYEEDLDINPGSNFVIVVDDGSDLLFLTDGNGDDLVYPLSDTKPISRASLTDDGQFALFVGDDNKIHLITFDFQSGNFEESIIQNDPIWRNVAVSKDGTMIAGLASEIDNKIYVYSYALQQWTEFQLYNVTMSPNAPPLDNVVLADVIEFSHDGNYLMYDALNQITTTQQAWDIGFLEVWNSDNNTFGSGSIIKMFEGLDATVSIGNPTFSKNSPHIIAFDFLDEEENLIMFGLNLERGDIEVLFENLVLGYPSYSTDDQYLIFNAVNQEEENVVAIQPLNPDKISPADNPSIFIPASYWGVWFSNGDRDLSTNTTETQIENTSISTYPNPVNNEIMIDMHGITDTQNLTVHIVDILGRTVWHQNNINNWNPTGNIIPLNQLQSGTYILQITGNGTHMSTTFVKN